MFVAKNEEMVPVAKTGALYAPRHPFSEWVTCDNEIARNHPKHDDEEDITMSTTTPAPPPHQAPLPSLAGPITRARASDLNFVMLLKNEGPEE
jgi:hypothetical protein